MRGITWLRLLFVLFLVAFIGLGVWMTIRRDNFGWSMLALIFSLLVVVSSVESEMWRDWPD